MAGLAVAAWLTVLPGSMSPCPASGIEIPINVLILNSPPRIVGIFLVDERRMSTSAVDPGIEFTVEAKVRDNNTVSDVTKLSLLVSSGQMSPGTGEESYAYTWTASRGFAAAPYLVQPACRMPSNPDLVEGTWRFVVKLPRTATASRSWSCQVTVEDEENSVEGGTTFTVNRYISIGAGATTISFSGSPGSSVPAKENPIELNYLANHPFEVGGRATTFTGRRVSSFTLGPERFRVSRSASGDGGVSMSLERKVLLEGVGSGEGAISYHIFVSIPEPFLDQDYAGVLTFDFKPGD